MPQNNVWGNAAHKTCCLCNSCMEVLGENSFLLIPSEKLTLSILAWMCPWVCCTGVICHFSIWWLGGLPPGCCLVSVRLTGPTVKVLDTYRNRLATWMWSFLCSWVPRIVLSWCCLCYGVDLSPATKCHQLMVVYPTSTCNMYCSMNS